MQPSRLLNASEASRLGVQETLRRDALTRFHAASGPVTLVAAVEPAMAVTPVPVAVLDTASLAA